MPGRHYNIILCQANGILNVGAETRIYHGRWRNVGGHAVDESLPDYRAEVALATLPRDRWGAMGLNPGADVDLVCAAPITLGPEGAELTLNAKGVGGITVELLDEQFRSIPGYSGANAGHLVGSDGLDCPVVWPGETVASLGERQLRAQVRLQRNGGGSPQLYALAWHDRD